MLRPKTFDRRGCQAGVNTMKLFQMLLHGQRGVVSVERESTRDAPESACPFATTVDVRDDVRRCAGTDGAQSVSEGLQRYGRCGG